MTPDKWQEHIQSCKVAVAVREEITDRQTAISLLTEQVPAAVARSLVHVPSPVAVLFSGGVDSTFLCYLLKRAGIDFVAVTVGFQDNPEQKLPDDILVAREIATRYNFTHIEKIYNYDEVEELFKETVAILGPDLTNAVNVGVGSVELAGILAAKRHNPSITHFMGGLGSEEIFAGYKRHSDADDITAECWSGLFGMYERDLLRDWAIADAKNITWLTPLLDKVLIIDAMTIHSDLKIRDGLSKMILRDCALALGLDSEFALRPKKAAQYGSRTDSALDKLAKKSGFKFKRDYLAFLVEQEK